MQEKMMVAGWKEAIRNMIDFKVSFFQSHQVRAWFWLAEKKRFVDVEKDTLQVSFHERTIDFDPANIPYNQKHVHWSVFKPITYKEFFIPPLKTQRSSSTCFKYIFASAPFISR